MIAAGSLLGLALSRRSENASCQEALRSWPVGKVSFLDLHPMTFAEFVRATEGDQLASLLETADPASLKPFSERLTALLKTYLYVGGMPEAVQAFCDSSDFRIVRTIQNDLLRGYELDFSKHVESPRDTERIRETWKSVPVQLARESDMKRFVYASIKQNARGRDYRDAVSWLVDAGLVVKIPRVSKPGIPLYSYEDDAYFKLYLLDVGLLGAATNLDARTIADGDRLFTEFKGAYAEQYVCQQLVACNASKLHYWSADGKQSKGEVDFLCERAGKVLPIEVKADKNVAGGSVSSFAKRYGIERSIRFSMRDWQDQGWLLNVPLYLAGDLERLATTREGSE